MNKFYRKISDFCSNLAMYAFLAAFTLACIGLDILVIKWILKLLGVI